ncbi:MAG TPA: murein L,D-transpeptidase catalytic domain family protein, partial [Thermoanaerobaculia bacterium]
MVKSFAAPSGACDRFASRPVSRRLLGGLVALFAIAFGIAARPSHAAPRAVVAPSKAAAAAVDPQTVPAVLSTRAAYDGLSPQALDRALAAVACARARGVAGKSDLLTLIDYSLPSTAPRLWVLDLANRKVLYHELVAHGAGSGDNYASRFSNLDGSR